MISNIPIFRAKKINSDEYLIGYLKFDRKHNHYSINPIDDENTWHKIEENTLSIHFKGMIDIKGDKIFASLQDDGKGGDMVDLPDYLKAEKDTERIAVVIMKSFNEYIAFCKNGAIYRSCHFVGNSKVIGIQK